MMAMSKDEEGPDKDKMMAKMKVIHELRQMAQDMMGEKLDEGMKKVTVASDDKEGLKEGLEKAEEIVEEGPEAMMGDEMMPRKDSYEPEDLMAMEESDDMEYEEEMSEEDIDAKIAELMKMKEMMRS